MRGILKVFADFLNIVINTITSLNMRLYSETRIFSILYCLLIIIKASAKAKSIFRQKRKGGKL